MSALLIARNFDVFVPGEPGKPERRVVYRKGMVVEETALPADQSAKDWIAKGLAERPKARSRTVAGDPPR
jgi:hypothetical protein